MEMLLPSVINFFHVSLYFVIVTIKFCLDLLVAIPLLGGDGDDDHGIVDKSLVDAVERLIATVGFIGRLASGIASSRRISAIAICLSLLISPSSGRFWKNVVCFWLVATRLSRSLSRNGKIVARVFGLINEDQLWRFLSTYIEWTRSVTLKYKSWSRGVVFGRGSSSRRNRGRIILCTIITLFVFVIVDFSSLRKKSWRRAGAAKAGQEGAVARGFTARVKSCYDGDTCRLHDIEHDGRRLPGLFQKLSVRIKGIDAPEIGARAGCDLEACLAVLARQELESILGIVGGSGGTAVAPRVSLVDCTFDKYGGRIACDVSVPTTDNDNRPARDSVGDHGVVSTTVGCVASEMLRSGLAVPYDGKRKVHADSWCDPDLLTAEQVLACG